MQGLLVVALHKIIQQDCGNELLLSNTSKIDGLLWNARATLLLFGSKQIFHQSSTIRSIQTHADKFKRDNTINQTYSSVLQTTAGELEDV